MNFDHQNLNQQHSIRDVDIQNHQQNLKSIFKGLCVIQKHIRSKGSQKQYIY